MDRKERTIFVTIIINILLVVFKFWLANTSGSEALRASAIHSVTDVAIGIFVILGLLISRWDVARSRFKQRINQIESWIALLIAGAIFYVAYDIIREVLTGEIPELRNLVPIIFASLFTVVAAYFTARYKLYVGKQTGSLALLASGAHSQMDIYASIVVVAGLAGAALGLPNLDRTAAALVVLFILFAGFEIGSSAFHALRSGESLEIDGESEHQHAHYFSKRWRIFMPIAGMLLVVIYLSSGLYVVEPGEFAIVRRFGLVIDSNVGPGLHYRLPAPIERVDIIAASTIRQIEPATTTMLTGDQSLISIRFSVHYNITDTAAYLLNIEDPEQLISQVSEASMREVVAQEGVDSLLTVDKSQVEENTTLLVQSVLDSYNSGLQVIGIQLLESNPPAEIADTFRDVASADEDQNTYINEAQAYANEIVPQARGNASETVRDANIYSSNRLAQANGESTIFTNQQTAYVESPVITSSRLYLEAVESVLSGVRKFVLDPSIQIDNTELWFPGTDGTQAFPPLP